MSISTPVSMSSTSMWTYARRSVCGCVRINMHNLYSSLCCSSEKCSSFTVCAVQYATCHGSQTSSPAPHVHPTSSSRIRGPGLASVPAVQSCTFSKQSRTHARMARSRHSASRPKISRESTSMLWYVKPLSLCCELRSTKHTKDFKDGLHCLADRAGIERR